MVFPCSLEGEAEVLRLLAEGKLVLEPLITHVFDADDAPKAWDMLLNRPQEALGVVLKWGGR
jgi:threonine dehydrogenase-like Zn-dependent dehydrogenase